MGSHPADHAPVVHRLAAVLAAIAAYLCFAPAGASAHLAYYTAEDSYYCTLAASGRCWYDGDSGGTFDFGSLAKHSYAFQSVKDEGPSGSANVCSVITRESTGFNDRECGYGFKRNCWHLWQHSTDPLDCHDEDDNTHYVRLENGTGSTQSVSGHALW